MKTDLKIVFIAFDSGELSVRMASALADYAQVCLMLPHSKAQPYLKWLNPKLQFAPFHDLRLRQPLRQVYLMFQLVKQIKRFNPDVIHFQKGHLYFNLTLPWLRQYPIVISVHDPVRHPGDRSSAKTPQFVMDFAHRRADHIIVHNEQMKQVIIDRLGFTEHSISVVPLIERGDAETGQNIQEAGNEVLFFGRIWKYKGLEYLIRAEPLISAQVPDVKIVIAGTGENFKSYERMMVNPERFVIHNEFIPHERIPELFRRASVVALPYVEATQSGVIPTAYTYARPVVATTVGGLAAQVEHGRTGFLVAPRDEKGLADSIVRLLQNKELRCTLGANGQRKLASEWTADIVAKQTLPAYQKALNGAC